LFSLRDIVIMDNNVQLYIQEMHWATKQHIWPIYGEVFNQYVQPSVGCETLH
jgi:hypothetical protein